MTRPAAQQLAHRVVAVADHHAAGQHGADPQKYLTSILAKIGQTKLSDLDQFLPEKWKAEDAKEPTAHPVTPASPSTHP